MDRRFIGIQDLSQYLDVSVKTIRHWLLMRKIPYFKMGRLVRFDLQEIEKWAQERMTDTIK